VKQNSPTRQLREHPDLEQLKRQAQELLTAFLAGQPNALAEVNAHFRGADPSTFALHDAQLVLARSYGLESWPKLKAYVDGVTISRLAELVRDGDLAQVRQMLVVRPELANMQMSYGNEHRPLHYAVMNRSPEMTRLLMEHGADPRCGIHPHRDATTALTIATERGFDDIVAIIEREERRRRQSMSNTSVSSVQDELSEAILSGDESQALAMLTAGPSLGEVRRQKSGGRSQEAEVDQLPIHSDSRLPTSLPRQSKGPTVKDGRRCTSPRPCAVLTW